MEYAQNFGRAKGYEEILHLIDGAEAMEKDILNKLKQISSGEHKYAI